MASRCGAARRGGDLLLVVGALVSAVTPARAAFEAAPAAVEMQQRSGRIEWLASSLRSSGVRESNRALSTAGRGTGADSCLSSGAANASQSSRCLPAFAGARGVLDRDQYGAGSHR